MFSPIKEIIESYKKGKMVILIDDENRENEGDLLAPASLITAEQINFMAKHARGLICLTLTEERCDHLRLPLMVRSDNETNSTNFTLSIESTKGVTTGISANDRALTIRAATAIDAKPEDITCPGHVFPLRAKSGGVLVRAGHTEAGCDLAQLSNMPVGASVIVEIMKEDGSMARLEDLTKFSQRHDIKLGTIEALIRYRLENERLITEITREACTLKCGAPCQLIKFYDNVDNLHHHAIVFGDLAHHAKTWVRVHIQHYMEDLLSPISLSSGTPKNRSWKFYEIIDFMVEKSKLGDKGVVVLLNSASANQRTIASSSKHFDNRNYGKGAQILNALGIKEMSVLGSSSSYSGIHGFGLEVKNFLSREEYNTEKDNGY